MIKPENVIFRIILSSLEMLIVDSRKKKGYVQMNILARRLLLTRIAVFYAAAVFVSLRKYQVPVNYLLKPVDTTQKVQLWKKSLSITY